MKPIFICIITLFAGISAVSAQSEVPADTLSSKAALSNTYSGDIPSSEKNILPEVKNFDGYLLDMSLMKTTAPGLPKFTLEIPDASKDYSSIFRLNPDAMYSQGLSNIFSLSNSIFYSMNPFGLTGFWSSPDNLQMGSFKLKNGMRINTYGEYNKDGWRVPNPSALPWEKNNFKGAFEMKSANGAFGIRIEVQQGNQRPFY